MEEKDLLKALCLKVPRWEFCPLEDVWQDVATLGGDETQVAKCPAVTKVSCPTAQNCWGRSDILLEFC